MRTELEDWKNGWFGMQLGLKAEEIDLLIGRLQMLKTEPDQHFHLTSIYQGKGGLGDITIYVQGDAEVSNMESVGGKAYSSGEIAPGSDA